MIRKPKWDYTHLYAAIFNALERMEPLVVGEQTHHLLSKAEIRKFKIAKELARRLALGQFNDKDYDLFTQQCGFDWEDETGRKGYTTFECQRIHTTGGKFDHSVEHFQQKHFIELLTRIMRSHSLRWWD